MVPMRGNQPYFCSNECFCLQNRNLKMSSENTTEFIDEHIESVSRQQNTNMLPHKKRIVDLKPQSSEFCCEICFQNFSSQLAFFVHLKHHYEQQPQTVEKKVILSEDEFSSSNSEELIMQDIRNVVKQVEQMSDNDDARLPDLLDVYNRDQSQDYDKNLEDVVDIFKGNITKNQDFVVELEDFMEGGESVAEDNDNNEDFEIIEEIMNEEEIMYKISVSSPTENKDDFIDIKRKQHIFNRQNACRICNKIFNSRNALRYHNLTHENRKDFYCKICEKSFRTKHALTIHTRIHDNERPYHCQHCDKQFRQSSDLKYHISSIHSTIKTFVCDFCEKSFARRYSLTLHRKIHTGEKNFICEFSNCNKAFSASSYLKLHQISHTGDKKHECPECKKKFRNLADLTRHKRTHTRVKKIATKGLIKLE